MQRSLNMYFHVNPMMKQVRQNERMLLVVWSKNKEMKLRMNLDVAKEQGRKRLLVQIF